MGLSGTDSHCVRRQMLLCQGDAVTDDNLLCVISVHSITSWCRVTRRFGIHDGYVRPLEDLLRQVSPMMGRYFGNTSRSNRGSQSVYSQTGPRLAIRVIVQHLGRDHTRERRAMENWAS